MRMDGVRRERWGRKKGKWAISRASSQERISGSEIAYHIFALTRLYFFINWRKKLCVFYFILNWMYICRHYYDEFIDSQFFWSKSTWTKLENVKVQSNIGKIYLKSIVLTRVNKFQIYQLNATLSYIYILKSLRCHAISIFQYKMSHLKCFNVAITTGRDRNHRRYNFLQCMKVLRKQITCIKSKKAAIFQQFDNIINKHK